MSEGLKKIMELGYNVTFTAKGRGNSNEFKVKLVARIVKKEEEDYNKFLERNKGEHFVAEGYSLEEVAENILDQILEKHYQ